MPTFKLTAAVTVTAVTTVEAASVTEAIAIARDRGVEIGGANTSVSDREVWVIEEADGEPMSIRSDSD